MLGSTPITASVTLNLWTGFMLYSDPFYSDVLNLMSRKDSCRKRRPRFSLVSVKCSESGEFDSVTSVNDLFIFALSVYKFAKLIF